MSKTYTLFAGVNGAGKSTLYKTNYFDKNQSRVNTDEIVLQIGEWSNTKDQMEASRIAVHKIKEYFDNGISFNQESTLCGKSILNNVLKAKEKGYEVTLHYVGLDNPDLAKERVRSRVLKGGHDIPVDTIEKRYHESLSNLQKILPYCDNAIIYDNTNDLDPIFSMIDGKAKLNSNCRWFEPIYRSYELDHIKKDLAKSGYQPTEKLIHHMKKINQTFHSIQSVKDVKNLYKNMEALTKTDRDIISDAAKDFIKTEKLQKQKIHSLER